MKWSHCWNYFILHRSSVSRTSSLTSIHLNAVHICSICIAVVVDRCLGLSLPEGCFFSFRGGAQFLTCAWLAICGFNLPLFVATDTAEITAPNGSTTVHCYKLKNLDPISRRIYWLSGRVLVYLVPLVIILVSYTGIYWRMRRAHSQVRIKTVKQKQIHFVTVQHLSVKGPWPKNIETIYVYNPA